MGKGLPRISVRHRRQASNSIDYRQNLAPPSRSRQPAAGAPPGHQFVILAITCLAAFLFPI
jgi:hypothetical protein